MRHHDHEGERKRIQVARIAKQAHEVGQHLAQRRRPAAQVLGERRHDQRAAKPDQHGEHHQQQERRRPVEVRPEHHAGRHAGNRGQRERGHDGAGGRAAPLDRNHVADDRHDHRAQHAAGDAGKSARREQQRIAAGQRAAQIGQREQRIDRQQQLAPVEAVDIGGGEQAREPRAPRIGRHGGREGGRRDAEAMHDLRAQAAS